LALALYASIFWRAAFISVSILAHRRIQVHTIVGIAILFVVSRLTFTALGLYQSKRLAPLMLEIIDLLKASGAVTLFLSFSARIFDIQTVAPVVLLRFLPIVTLLLILSRLVMRHGLKLLRKRGHNLRHLLIVGTNARAVAFAHSVLTKPDLGYIVIGFVDDAWIGPVAEGRVPTTLVSDIAGFRSYLRAHIVDEVVVALPIKSFYDEEEEMLQICNEHGVIARVLTDFFEAPGAASRIAQLGRDPLVTFYSNPTDDVGFGIKRLVDIVVSLALLIALGPFMLAALILVRLESRGSAIFTQERIGLNKRRFSIYKFRTMVDNAEILQRQLESRNEFNGPVFKIKDDPRITRLGRFLRKTSIDELPQLLNVVRGDMSLVGPRPLPVRDYTGFDKDWQRRRFSVRPGITCLWQVSGRSGISFDQWMRLDMEYIDRWSLWLDFKILAMTIPAVLKGTGAA
jgi:exopolysaccharide biosynthesis polyprenyl glycosylphosphotransferase